MDETGARGLAGDLFVDGALGSRTAWLHEPYTDAPERVGNCHLDPEVVEAHVRACTEAEVTGGFPRHRRCGGLGGGRRPSRRVVADLGVAAVARCGHRLEHLEMVTAGQAAKLGAWGVIASVQPNFDALWGGPDGMYARRLGAERAVNSTHFALLASQGVPLALGSDCPGDGHRSVGKRARGGQPSHSGSAVSARAAFAAATRGGWRASGVRDGQPGPWCPARRPPTRMGCRGT